MKLQSVSKCRGRRRPRSQIKDRQAEGGCLPSLCVSFGPSTAWVRPTTWGDHLRSPSSSLIQNHNTTDPRAQPSRSQN